ncbi:hypothetical protein CORC01_13947, partial [Colletotrichum orchidophilum]
TLSFVRGNCGSDTVLISERFGRRRTVIPPKRIGRGLRHWGRKVRKEGRSPRLSEKVSPRAVNK